MEIDDHFDPVDFYSNDCDQVVVSENTINNLISDQSSNEIISITTYNNTNSVNNGLRRSGRPKPAAESLLSSPPAIKFYESTVIKKTSKPSNSSRSALRNKNNSAAALSYDDSPVANSKVLKLRLTGPDSTPEDSTSNTNPKENSLELSPKRNNNLRVVKLMMPDINEDGTSTAVGIKKSPVKNVKILPLLAPKPPPSSTTGINQVIKVKEFKLRERKSIVKSEKSNDKIDVKDVKKKEYVDSESKDINTKRRKKNDNPTDTTVNTTTPAAANNANLTTTPVIIPKSTPHIINEDVCSSCGGLGNFICCDACPRSFHFTCAEPPLDPQNLPEDDWYCNECRHSNNNNSEVNKNSNDIWGLMIEKAGKINPKCFVMPRRFRYQPKEEDLIKLQTGQLFKASAPVDVTATKATTTTTTTTHSDTQENISITGLVKVDHCGYELVAPDISAAKSPTGYCHFCGRFGLTKTALNKTDDLPNVPGDPRYHRPILSCSICPLYWHLDCLETPLVSFPPSSVTWTCPIHFTSEQCVALDVAESLVQASTLLPESAIRLQFMRKAERLKEHDRKEVVEVDEFEELYGVKDCINVPENIKSTYQ